MFNKMLLNVIILAVLLKVSLAFCGKNLAITIIGQQDKYHSELANKLKDEIITQATQLSMTYPQIFLHPEIFQDEAGWTIYPLLPSIKETITEDVKWIVFVEDRTHIKLEILLETLEQYNPEKELWIGHALTDSEATIIHHFAFYKDPSVFKYPNMGSGFAMTLPLLERLVEKLSNKNYEPPNFHIDASHEFALFVSNKGSNNLLQHAEKFCSKEGENCATFPSRFQPCGEAKSTPTIAVKTFHEFHKNRVQIVLQTWGQYTQDLLIFSDTEDTSISSIKLDVENTEQGHCAKTIEILKFLNKRLESLDTEQWIVLVDDDTILSISRISNLLTCFNSTESPMMIGERYRFSLNGDGYNYLTGGAGIALNRKAIEILAKHCHCPKPNSPDDMILGACARMFAIDLVHFPYFHQARATDYAQGYLETKDAVSFHKHWMLDPVLVYDEYFREDDKLFFAKNNDEETPKSKDEL